MIDAIKAVAEAFRNMLEAAGSAINAIAMSEEECAAIRQEIDRQEAEVLERANEEANAQAVPFDVLLEELAAFGEETRSITPQDASMFWDEDARLLSGRLDARQREILHAMQDESARRAMERRKLMHDDGHPPDGIRPAGKAP